MELGGRTALITGGAKRLGSAIAASLAEEGVNIILHYRKSGDEASALLKDLKGLGVDANLMKADFGDADASKDLIRKVASKFGKFDFLVNSASIFQKMDFYSADLKALENNVQINAWSPFQLGREFAGRFGTGKIINILDTKVAGYNFDSFPYYLSKKLLETMTFSMALKLAPGVTVNAVAPGLILPPEGKDQRYLDGLKSGVPLKRHGSPSDIADAIIFLLKSDFITGQVIYVDGGEHLNPRIVGY